MITEEQVICVNEKDEQVGIMNKQEAHEKGVLHRAFSVFIFNSKGEMLLQKRAQSKYHSGGLWTNACCSHPRAGETIVEAANRRLNEELNLNVPLQTKFSFIYKAELNNNLVEHEFDYVLFGVSDEVPVLNTDEAEDFKYLHHSEISNLIKQHPQQFTEWFKICFNEVVKNLA